MQPDGRLPEILLERLRQLKRRIVGVSIAEGIGLTVLAVSTAMACVLLLDVLVDLPLTVRVGMLWVVPVIGVLTGIVTILLPLLRRYQQTELAAVVEAAHPELRERLLSTVELVESTARGEDGGSPVMQNWLLQQTVQFAEKTDFADVVDARRAVRRCWMGGAAFLALLLPLLFATQAYATLLSRFFNPWGNYERLQNLVLTVDNADRVVGRGDDVTLLARVSWRMHAAERPEAAWLDWSSDGINTQSRRMDWNDQQQAYVVQLPRISSGFAYTVAAQQSRTRQHRIDVVDRPAIRQFVVDLVPPAYTGNPAEHHDPLLGEVVAIEQSHLDLQLTFDKPVVSAELLWLDGPAPKGTNPPIADELVDGVPVRRRTTLPLSDDGLSSEFKIVASLDQPSGRFAVRMRDEYGLTAREESIRRLTIQPDAAPLIDFADREQHPEARPGDTVRFPIRASDDFGLATVELHYDWTRNGVKESAMKVVPTELLGQRGLEHLFELDLSKLALTPGMQLSVRARATDERPVPGPNETWTGTRTLQILADAKPYGDQTVAELQHRTNQAMDHLKADLEKEKQAARKLQNQAQSDASRKNEWHKEAEAAALEEQLRQLSEQLQQLSAVMEQQPVFEHLAQRAQQIAEQSLAQAAAKAQQAQQSELSEKQQQYSEAADKIQKASNELQSLQEKFQELAQLQRDLLELNRLADLTEQLATDVDHLSTRQQQQQQPTANQESRQQWQADHQQMVARHEKLEEDLGTLLEKHPDLLDKARETLQQQLASLAEQAEQLARQQQSLVNANRNDVNMQRKDLQPLRMEQEKLLQQERKLAEDLQLPGSDELNTNGAKETRNATRSLEQGNLQTAEAQHARAQEQLQQLAQALSENSQLPQDPQQAAQALQQRQTQLAEKTFRLPQEPTPESREQMAKLAGEQAAIRRAAAEIPKTDSTGEMLQRAVDQSREAAQFLAENQAQPAKERSQQAAESLQKFIEALQAAQADPAAASAKPSEGEQKNAKKEQQRNQELQQRANQLAADQQQLAEKIKAKREEQQAASAAPNAQQQTANAAEESSGKPPQDSAPAGMAGQPSLPATPPAGETKPDEKQADNAKPPKPQNASSALPQQQQLTQQAKQLGEEVRQLGLKNEPANKGSWEFPDAARQAADALQQLNFQRAAELANRAAEKSQQLAGALSQPDGQQTPPRLQEQAQAAAQAQQQVADQLKQLAESPAAQHQFRSDLQQQYRDRADDLSQQLANRAEDLGLKRIDRPSQADVAKQASQQADRAEQTLQQSLQQSQQGNRGEAAQTGEQAVEPMRQAANLARQASNGANPNRPPETNVPGEVGRQVAESSQRLSEAGEQLSKLKEMSAQEPGTPESSMPRKSESSQAQQGQQGKDGQGEQGKGEGQQGQGEGQGQKRQGPPQQGPGQQPGGTQPSSAGQQMAGGQQQPGSTSEAGSAGAASSLREAAKGMRMAAQQMGVAMNKNKNGLPQQQSGQESQQSQSNDAADSAFTAGTHLQQLENALGKVSERDWGKLPGTLQTDMLESSQRSRDPAYRGLIRRYFEDISKARPAELSRE
ncbi:hypothetical protein [Planctomicrobium piriforme]|uniref:DUF4175 family protein n=1 Tax=Planctomicrobium piriforme TaxID=1576369 RepID=A0A1I3GP38_9PLAN|nr:hypothetical protein [Planctomicrobium piriforme]SFI25220.1 hypothetical protein SAMN05421753_10775 [Planctomicrobium piriforme]